MGCFGSSSSPDPSAAGMATPGMGGTVAPDAAVTAKPLGFAQDKALSPGGLGAGNTATPNGMWSDKGAWTSNNQLSGADASGGFGNAMKSLMVARNPGLAGLLGSAGVSNMPSLSDLWAHMTNAGNPAPVQPQQNQPTRLVGMANPGTMASTPYMTDPAQQSKGGGGGLMSMARALV
jgi:hypothetical protein